MPAYLIFGPAGSGKTTLGREIEKRGYLVIDMDTEPGLVDWVDTDSSKQSHPAQNDEQWRRTHERDWDANKMKTMFSRHRDETVFYCGGAQNIRDYLTYFDECFGLHAKNATIKARLQKRNTQRWHNKSDELARLLDWNQRFPKFCADYGVILIDSSRPVREIADDLLSRLKTQ